MKRILITGMSGTGKSSVVGELAARGFKALDTDWDPEWELPPPDPQDGPGWLWRQDRIDALLDQEDASALFIAACVENQGVFYDRFDEIILLTASPELTVQRLRNRTSNAYGSTPAEVAQVLHFKETVEPLLRRRATLEVDTAAPLDEVVARLARLVDD